MKCFLLFFGAFLTGRRSIFLSGTSRDSERAVGFVGLGIYGFIIFHFMVSLQENIRRRGEQDDASWIQKDQLTEKMETAKIG